jgi:hypothetical protein
MLTVLIVVGYLAVGVPFTVLLILFLFARNKDKEMPTPLMHKTIEDLAGKQRGSFKKFIQEQENLEAIKEINRREELRKRLTSEK